MRKEPFSQKCDIWGAKVKKIDPRIFKKFIKLVRCTGFQLLKITSLHNKILRILFLSPIKKTYWIYSCNLRYVYIKSNSGAILGFFLHFVTESQT